MVISKEADFDPETGTVVYTITVANAGPDAADNVQVTEVLPGDVTFLSTNGCAEDPNEVPTCSLGTIAPDGTASFTVTVSVNAGASEVITNSASVTSDADDPDAGNNEVSLATTVKLKDPGSSYVDANNDQRFLVADGDVLLTNGEVADGRFDTRHAEGGYATVILGAGLVLNGAPIIAPSISFRADGDLVVNTDLTATGRARRHGRGHGHSDGGSDGGRDRGSDGGSDGGGDINLRSRAGSVNVSGVLLEARGDIELRAAIDIDVAGARLDAGKDVELKAGGDVDGDFFTDIEAGGDVDISAGVDVNLNDAVIDARKEVEIEAGGSISVVDALIDGREVELRARDSIFASLVSIDAREIEIRAGGNVDLTDAILFASQEIEIRAGGDVDLIRALLDAGREIEVRALGAVSLLDAELAAGRLIDIRGLTVDQTGATLTARRVRIREG